MSQPHAVPAAQTRAGELLRAGIASYKAGELDAAERFFLQALRLAPGHPHALHLVGLMAHERGRHREAIRLIGKAIRRLPDKAHFHNNLGNAHRALGEGERARRAYAKALALDPRYAKAHFNLGVLLAGEDDFEAARQHLRRAVESDPGLAEAWLELARLFRRQGLHAAAIDTYQQVLKVRPDDLAALVDLGALYQVTVQTPRAVRLLERACVLDPEHPLARFNLAQAYAELGRGEEAEAAYRKVVEVAPGNLQAALALAKIERDRCDWRGWQEMAYRLAHLCEAEIAEAPPPFLLNLYPTPPEVHRLAAEAYSRRFTPPAERASERPSSPRAARSTTERLRIGYLSADFRQHPIGYLTHGLFALHDRARWEVCAYSLIPAEDPVTAAVRAGCDLFRDASRLADEAVARQIAEDGVDILVDLTGYTTYSRPGILARQPAPLQMQCFGYVQTLAAPFVQWTVADPRLLPPAQRTHWCERVIYLPDCLFPVSPLGPLGASPEPPPLRHDLGLPEEAPVLCSFNGPAKLDPPTFDAWMEILRRVPLAVLWLYDGDLPAARDNLSREAEARGVPRERLRFAGKLPYPRHLQRYRLADLFLDSFVYNAGATAIDALRKGLPVLTCPGEAPLSRMGGSILHAAGLADLVAGSREEYVARAVEVATDADLARELRRRAEEANGAPLFDLPRWMRGFEAGLAAAWDAHGMGQEGDVEITAAHAAGLEVGR